MPVSQLRRRFHTPEQINAKMKDRGEVLTHRAPVQSDPIEDARRKVNRMSALVAKAAKAFASGAGSLNALKRANEDYSNAVKDLEHLAPQIVGVSQSNRKALYQ